MITSQTSSISYVGDAVATEFPVPFPYLEPEYLTVVLTVLGIEYPQSLNIHYTVDEEESDGVYGTVIFTAAPPDGCTVAIGRSIPTTQEVDLQKSDRFNPDVVERMADKLTLLIQQNEAANAYTLRFPDGEPTPITNTLPVKALRPNTVLGFDEDGNMRLFTLGELVDGTLGGADDYAVVELAGNFEVSSGHRNRTIHSTDTAPAQAQNIITLPDPSTLPDKFFMSLVKVGTASVLFQSTATINAEVDPAELRRDKAGVVLYTASGEWFVVGAFGDSLPAPDTNIYQTLMSGIHYGAVAPTDLYIGRGWVDTANDNAFKVWDGLVWQDGTSKVKQANAAVDNHVIRKVAALPALPSASYPVDSIVVYSGALYINVAGAWQNTASGAANTLFNAANVVNSADLTRPAPAIGTAFFSFPTVTSGELTTSTDVPLTDNSLIFNSWVNGAAAKVDNRHLNATQRFMLNYEYYPAVGSGANALITLAYRTRPSAAGAWTAWTKLGDAQKPVNEPGHDQVYESLQWSGSLNLPSATDVQFGVIANRSGGTVEITRSRMEVFALNL